MFVVAQLSDLHFNGTPKRRARIQSAVDYVNARSAGIDALLITGDIADEGRAEQYREAKEALRSEIPMLIGLGNHDSRDEFHLEMSGRESADPVNRSLQLDGLLILMVDSSIPDSAEGALSADTLAWMDRQIATAPDDDVLIALHHPPATLAMPFMDSIRLTGDETLADFVARNLRIVGIVCGHAHSPAVTQFAGVPLCVAPGVSSVLNLPFEGTDVVNPVQPPGVAFHILDDHRLITHFRSVG